MKDRILEIVRTHPGLTAREIAAKLGVDRRDVNSILYHELQRSCYADNAYRWYPRSNRTNLKQRINDNRPNALTQHNEPDIELSKICNYYLSCISLEGRNSVSVFQTSMFDLDYIEIAKPELDISQDAQTLSFIQRANQGRKNIFLGYPVLIVKIHAHNGNVFRKLAPVFLFPINYPDGRVEISRFPMINLEVIKCLSSNDPNEQIRELIRLEDDLGLNSPDVEFDLYELVSQLRTVRDWVWKEEPDPDKIDLSTPLSSIDDDGLFNRSIIIKSDAPQYTQGLESELTKLSQLTERQYKNTALYHWIHGGITKKENVSNDISILEVLPLNLEQSEAVKTALESELTIVTGPPGTGKSQVVTDLIVNLAWKGKNALFSSKNNKAVDVVEQRVNNLGERPIMLRLGSGQDRNQLIQFFKDLLTISQPSETDQEDYLFYKKQYETLQGKIDDLCAKKEKTLKTRNMLDEAECKYCLLRENWKNYIDIIDDTLIDNFSYKLDAVKKSLKESIKDNHSLFVRLFWFVKEKSFYKKLQKDIQELNLELQRFGRNGIDYSSNNTISANSFQSAEDYLVEIKSINNFKKLSIEMEMEMPFEVIDKKLIDIKEKQYDLAEKLWSCWLKVTFPSVPQLLRDDIQSLVAQMQLDEELIIGERNEITNTFNRIQRQLKNILPICAVTSLSVRNRVPFSAGIYDLLIIDEASQCDIASILPLLYRTKRAVVIGDPKQLSHITSINRKQDSQLLSRFEVNPSWSYTQTSLYDKAQSLSTNEIVKLKDHHRCHGDIIGFSNKEFYGGNLRIATSYDRLNIPSNGKPGIRWINVIGNTTRPYTGGAFNNEEIEILIIELQRLVDAGYNGSIGVVTPFRAQANKLTSALEKETELYNALLSKNDFMAATVHKFQGDERDLMFFSTVISSGTKQGALEFLKNTGNLFNVAITRARSCLIVVGDENYC